jgi:hypothetical protein
MVAQWSNGTIDLLIVPLSLNSNFIHLYEKPSKEHTLRSSLAI